MRKLRNSVIATVAAVATAALVATGVPALAVEGETPELTPTFVTGEVPLRVSDPDAVPVVDSEIGLGSALGTTPEAVVPLGAAASGVSSVLVRVSALSATADTTVSRSGGVPALFVAAGRSASSTLLLPVQSGGVQLWADAPVNVRVEVLAGFSGRADQPGTMIPLAAPVLRADTTAGLAASGIGATEVPFGVVGAGEVPSEGVRAVYVTYDITAGRATTVETGGQRLVLEPGRSVVTTIVAPDASGNVGVRSLGGDVQLRAYVGGWIPAAPFQGSQISVRGSFVPTASLDESGVDRVHGNGMGMPVSVTRHADAEYTIALVGATEATETTLLDLGVPYTGRGRGAVVDRTAGAVPQLTVLTATPGGDEDLTLRRGQARVTWAPIGDILGAEITQNSAVDPTIAITSPAEGASLDLEDGGYFTLEGTIGAPDVTIDRVEVSGPDGLIGTADVRMDEDGLHWEFGAAAPHDGTFTFTATVYDRAGASGTATRTLNLVAVDAEDTVVAPDVYVFNEDPAVTELTIVDAETETVEVVAQPEFVPGDTIVAAASAATPDGLFRTVASIDRRGDVWRVTTTDASISDVFFQADIDQDRPYEDFSNVVIDDDPSDDPDRDGGADANTGDWEYGTGDAGYTTTYVAHGPQVNLAPDAGACVSDDLTLEEGAGEGDLVPTCSEEFTTDPGAADGAGTASLSGSDAFAVRPAFASGGPVRAASSDGSFEASLGFNANVKFEAKTGSSGMAFKDYMKSVSDPEAELTRDFNQMAREGKAGAAFSLKAQLGVKIFAKLDTVITWKWGFIPNGISLKSFKIGLETTLKASLGLKLYLTASQTLKAYNTIANFDLGAITVWAGPVPIVITNDAEVFQKTESKITASVAGELGVFRTDTFGIEYKPETGWKQIDEKPKVQANPFTPKSLESIKLEVSGSISTGPGIKAKTALWGMAGVEIATWAPAGVNATWNYKPWVPEMNFTISVFIKLNLSGSLAQGKVIDKLSTLFGKDRFEFEFYSQEWSWDIWKGKWPIIEAPTQPSNLGVRERPEPTAILA
jgi:hypothetical protein